MAAQFVGAKRRSYFIGPTHTPRTSSTSSLFFSVPFLSLLLLLLLGGSLLFLLFSLPFSTFECRVFSYRSSPPISFVLAHCLRSNPSLFHIEMAATAVGYYRMTRAYIANLHTWTYILYSRCVYSLIIQQRLGGWERARVVIAAARGSVVVLESTCYFSCGIAAVVYYIHVLHTHTHRLDLWVVLWRRWKRLFNVESAYLQPQNIIVRVGRRISALVITTREKVSSTPTQSSRIKPIWLTDGIDGAIEKKNRAWAECDFARKGTIIPFVCTCTCASARPLFLTILWRVRRTTILSEVHNKKFTRFLLLVFSIENSISIRNKNHTNT